MVSKDNSIAEIKREQTVEYMNSMPGYIKPPVNYEEKYGAKGYAIYVLTPVDLSNSYFPWLDGNRVGYHSFSLAYDLASLKSIWSNMELTLLKIIAAAWLSTWL